MYIFSWPLSFLFTFCFIALLSTEPNWKVPLGPSDPLGIHDPQLEPERSDFIFIKNTSEQINIKIN